MHSLFPDKIIKWALMLALTAALAFTSAAFAEDAPPDAPAAAPAETELAAPSEEPALEPAPTEDPVVATGETPPALAEPPIADPAPAPAESPAAVETAAGEVTQTAAETQITEPIAQAVEDLAAMDIALAAEGGEVLDLASADTVEALASPDPYYFVGAVKYSFLVSGCPPLELGSTCFHDANPIQFAITFVGTSGLIPTDRKIYVESGAYTGPVEVNGLIAPVGQLTGLIGEDTGSGLPVINNYVYIHDTTLGFTLSGFAINTAAGSAGAVRIIGNTGTLTLQDLTVRNSTGQGIDIYSHRGAIILNNVVSSDNFGNGVSITNDLGVFPTTITNSEFDRNDDAGGTAVNVGLWIFSKGPVTLNYISASTNDGRGGDIYTDKTVTIKNSGFNANYCTPFNAASGYGLWVWTDYLTNHLVLENVQADDNAGSGIYAVTGGNLIAKNISAYRNTYSGASFSLVGSAAVSASVFTDNGDTGLEIHALKSILVNSVQASLNAGNGVTLDNCHFNGIVCEGSGTVQVIGATPNRFIDNSYIGLNIESYGTVTLTNFEASDNDGTGVKIWNSYDGSTGIVTVNTNYVPPFGTFSNILHLNGNYGIEVDSLGSISLDKVLALENTTNYTISLVNRDALSPKPVTVKNTQIWKNDYGFDIETKGNVLLSNCAAYDTLLGDGVFIDTTYGPGNVVISAATMNDFGGNDDYALDIKSKGTITINHVDATGSTWGSSIHNDGAPSAKFVTITDSIFSEASLGYGLNSYSNGPITLRNVTAYDNHQSGILLENIAAISPQPVMLSNVTASNNTSTGIYVNSQGNISAANITASYNGGQGMDLNSCDWDGSACEGTGNVTVGGTWNIFSGNHSSGLDIESGGNISLGNIEAFDNDGAGIYATNGYDGETGNITMTASSGKYNLLYLNYYEGLSLYSRGTISVSRTIAEKNRTNGGYFNNEAAASPKNVTLSDSNFDHNQAYGLQIYSNGTVTLKGVSASGNTRYNTPINDNSTSRDSLSAEYYMYEQGRYESWWFDGSGPVTIQVRSNDFVPQVYLYDEEGHLLAWDDNSGALIDAFISSFTLPSPGKCRIEIAAREGGFGIYDIALNDPAISTIDYYYENFGAYFYNTSVSADFLALPLGSKGNTFNYNSSDGVYIYSRGNITISQATAEYNFGEGLNLRNDSSPSPKNITLLNVNANGNYDDGVYAFCDGAITWNSGGASGNREYGAHMGNTSAASPKPITILNAAFNKNDGDYGLSAYSLGNITLTNVGASNNTGSTAYGIYVDNCDWNGSSCDGSGTITITGKNNGEGANYNTWTGIYATSFGNIRLQNSEAIGNAFSGAVLANNYNGSIGTITVAGTLTAPAEFSGNLGYHGLEIQSNCAVAVTNVKAEGNLNGSGVSVNNIYTTAPEPVVLNRVFASSGNSVGISIFSCGAVTGIYLRTNENLSTGLYFANDFAVTAQPISISLSEMLANGGEGINLRSDGKITLNAVRSNNNHDYGANIDTMGDFAVLSTLGLNQFNSNKDQGINVLSAANISLSKVSVNENGIEGLNINSAGTLSINSGSFNRNGYEGIYASLSGDAGMEKVQAINNGSGSFNVDGIHISTPGSATVKILNSIATGHEGSGIQVNNASVLLLTGTYYYGNDTNNDGQPNVDWP